MTRPDGRQADELRPITIEAGFTDVPVASVIVRFGRTAVWCSASIDESVPRWLKNAEPPKGWVTAEYMMLPGSTSPRSRREGRKGQVGGRTQEIQRLIGRSLRAVIDLEKLGPRQITLDCEVLQADGGTRTAAITGAFVALALAVDQLIADGAISENPLTDTIAAVSCGVVDEAAVLDLPYVEDVAAAVDMNIVMTGSGAFVEVQGTGEESTFSRDELSELLRLGEVGVKKLTRLQLAALPPDSPSRALFREQ